MIRVGFGEADITAPTGADMPGSFTKRVNKGVLDRLLTTAAVIDDGQTRLALVGVDALFVPRPLVEKALRLIRARTSIPEGNVIIGASHTHNGGPVFKGLGSDSDEAYVDLVAEGIASAVAAGQETLRVAEIGAGTGYEDAISFNRRFIMLDGREITHPGKPGTPHHVQIVAPSGPIDPEVGVLAARDLQGGVFGLVVCFACHSTVVGGDRQTPDYAHYLRKQLKAHYGDDVTVVFLLGPCGDVTQVDNMSSIDDRGPGHAGMMGLKLASEVIQTLGDIDWHAAATIAAATENVELRIRDLPDAGAERPPFGLGSQKAFEPVYARERKLVQLERRSHPVFTSPVRAFRIGPLGIVTSGAEFFCELGLRIKGASLFDETWVVSLANDYIGYVPTPQAFLGGGYEPRTATSSKLSIEAGQRIVEASLAALIKVIGP